MPLTIPDQSIAAQGKVPDGMTAISNMVNLQNQTQQVKAHQIANQSNQAILDERNNVRSLFQNPQAMMDDQGNIDFNKAAPAIMSAAPTQGGQIITSMITAQKDSVAAKQALQTLNNNQRAIVGQYIMSLVGQDPETVQKNLAGLAQQQPGLSPAIDFAWKYHLAPATGDPKAFDNAILGVGKATMTPPQQAAAITPSIVQTDNGQQVISNNINPLAPGGVGSQPIAPIQKQLPPTTPVMGVNNAPGYLGPQDTQQTGPQGLDLSKLTDMQKQFLMKKDPQAFINGVQDFQNTSQQAPAGKPAFVASGLPVGAPEGISGTQTTINKHWADTQASAGTAAQDIGVLQNIKQHAPGAATSVAADRQAIVVGLAGLLGMDAGELKKTDTDLLAKNANMLALAGGNTDAARSLAEMANPNIHMTKEAIMQAANQVIAQRQLALARAKFLTPFKSMADQGHPEMYNNALNTFNSVADPRVIQFNDMTPEEKTAMKSSMTPKERDDFGKKLGAARQLGIAATPGAAQ